MKLSHPDEWRDAPHKALTLIGMSGAGKTVLSNRLPKDAWFHYSVDYRIGTKYMDEPILDDIKARVMRDPYLADLLRADAIYVRSNIRVENLRPLSMFIGKLGDPERGGLALEEYLRRQRIHRRAEVNALLDVEEFIRKARDIYAYPHFVNDAGGSVCEVVDLDDPEDPVMEVLGTNTVVVYLEGDEDFLEQLIERQAKDPKPLYYPEPLLREAIGAYLSKAGLGAPEEMDPDEFSRHAFARLARWRGPRYRAMAERLGYVVPVARASEIRSAADIDDLVADAIAREARAAA